MNLKLLSLSENLFEITGHLAKDLCNSKHTQENDLYRRSKEVKNERDKKVLHTYLKLNFVCKVTKLLIIPKFTVSDILL